MMLFETTTDFDETYRVQYDGSFMSFCCYGDDYKNSVSLEPSEVAEAVVNLLEGQPSALDDKSTERLLTALQSSVEDDQ